LQRPHHRRVRGRHLGPEAVSGPLIAPQAPPRGASAPLGATPCRGGANFSVYSQHAAAVDLLLFDRVDDPVPARTMRIDPAANRTYHYWHVFVPGVAAGQLYGYRVEGPAAPAAGMRFDAGSLLLD